jgi:hypothetical protein
VKDRKTTDTDIVGIKNIDTTVVVVTKSYVYTASGNTNDAFSMSQPGEAQAGVSKLSIVFLDGVGVVFASPDGYQACSGSASSISNLTENIFTKDQWEALRPTTIIAAVHDAVLHFFYRTVPLPPQVGLLMHCDNEDDGTMFIDSSGDGKTITRTSDAVQLATGFKFPPRAGFNSSGRVTVGPYTDLGFGGDFGIDMWSRNSNGTAFSTRTFFSNRLSAGAGAGFELCQDGNFLRYRSSTGTTVSGTTPIPDNSLVHIAFERLNGVMYAYVNGVPEFSLTDSRDFSANTTLCFWDNFGTSNTFNGYLDEIHVVTDSAPYGGVGFTPETVPYPDPSSVVPAPSFGYALDAKKSGFSFAAATTAATESYGRAGDVTRTSGTVPTSTIGTRSLTGSNGIVA